ncbi:MAG: IS1634 family transposase [Bacteroidales bacterium]|jgi:transposase|nr:IS1634 family transposase [Bacteroidales bacterium]
MYIQRNKSVNSKTGKVYRSVLLCSKYREGKKVKTRTLANLSHLPDWLVLGIENLLKSDRETTVLLKDIEVKTCVDYGFVFVLLEMMRQLRIDEVLEKTLSKSDACIVKAMLIGKIITGGSKLSIFNWLGRQDAGCKLLGLEMKGLKVDHLYNSLGQLCLHQSKIEKKWFRYHKGVSRRTYLYDLTGTYFEGKHNAFAAYGYNRDGKKGKMQMCVGLLTTDDGFPLRIQAFSGNTSDSTTVPKQIRSLKNDLGVQDIIFVGDRGMHITYNLENDPELSEENIKFITALTRSQIQTLISQDVLQLSLFSKNLAEVTLESKRYILSLNPDLQYKEQAYLDKRRKDCDALIEEVRKSWSKRCAQNEENLKKQRESPAKGKYKHLKTELNDKDIKSYIRRIEKITEKCTTSKYYTVEAIDNQLFTVVFRQDEFEKSRSLCGKYVIHTNVTAEEMTTEQVRGEYKKLQNVEHAFRDLKSDNISIRPVYHCNEIQTRGHVLLCMFAYAIIKAMEDKLFPFLKIYNKNNKTQLAFNDLTAELNDIKMCELKIGRGVTSVKYPELTSLQNGILDVLKIDAKKMTG